jgi:MFS family permease
MARDSIMAAVRTVDVQTFLNEHLFSRFQWMIFGLCFWVVLLDGFDTAAIGYIAPSLITEWGPERPALAPVLSAALFGLRAGAVTAASRSAFGGFLAAWMIPHWGWRSVLVLGGTTPLVLTVLMTLRLPESVRFMVATNQPAERIRSVLHFIAATVPDATSFVMHENVVAIKAKSGIGMVDVIPMTSQPVKRLS